MPAPHLKTHHSDLHWPTILPPQVAVLWSLWKQLDDSQWWSRLTLEANQGRQLLKLVEHYMSTGDVPIEVATTVVAALRRGASWREVITALPLTTRRDLQARSGRPKPILPNHGEITELKTSGSSGEPVSVLVAQLLFRLRSTLTLRGHTWHDLDFSQKFGAIRGGIREQGARQVEMPVWGGAVSRLFKSGPSAGLDITTPIDQQVQWLSQVRPNILLSLPSNIEALLDLLPEGWEGLGSVLTISETLSPELRQRIQAQWCCRVWDKYSSEELGTIAIECADGHYHCSEHLVVEVLNDDDRPCGAGEIGRVVVTDLWNFASPIIRYDIGDYAQVGDACTCGRGLFTLQRVMGRVRNIMTLPDGQKFWPTFGMRAYGELAPIQQMQFIQTELDALLVRYIAPRELSAEEEQAVTQRVQDYVGYSFRMTFERGAERLNEGRNFKFEEFKSLL